MDSLKIQGGVPLIGEIAIRGAKNAALPLLACGLMAGTGSLRLGNVPDLADTRLMKALVRHLGVAWSEDGEELSSAARRKAMWPHMILLAKCGHLFW